MFFGVFFNMRKGKKMSKEKATALEIVKDVYRRFAEGDIKGFLALCSDDIEWVVNGPATLEKCQAFKGHKGVQDFLSILGNSWEFSTFTPQQFIASEQTNSRGTWRGNRNRQKIEPQI
ncbi:MAG: hypothetical protein DRR16_04210 [Candidatus Parabeggiatoa sp. nov. 3]|nr:MAG: hypothetical protein DRR00_15710 [Gammaproteobacteria bacterium]RKZ65655.1 MAG: hypothetical protein DRQ99_12025 [Gammaproteobacteria bacterium]RKZ88745.1 MAG: hypothetical protein DRR16_04210 [Gammaproteobacteria bacterium]